MMKIEEAYLTVCRESENRDIKLKYTRLLDTTIRF
jgi:hypothetical protein